MSKEAIRPSSLDGIKRLAKSIKAEKGTQHTQALDEASRAAGFQNFRHASNTLRSPHQAEHKERLFITAYWKDRDNGTRGRETLTVWLSARWEELVSPTQLRNHRALMALRGEGPDHLSVDRLRFTQSEARSSVCAAARTLQFIDATKLRPSSSYSRIFPKGNLSNSIPGMDHYSAWYDPASKRYLLADEPYENAVEDIAHEREAWGTNHGYAIAKPKWAGMYAPDIGSQLYLIADIKKGIPLPPLEAALKGLPSPTVESDWSGESADSIPIFVSPGTSAKASEPKKKSAKKPSTKGNSVGYVMSLVGPSHRPNARMPIEAHEEVGRLLKGVLLDTYNRKGVYKKVNAIRCELDEWTQREYDEAALPSERFFNIYYRESGSSFAKALTDLAKQTHIDSLDKAGEILTTHYPDSTPLRSIMKKLAAAKKSLASWI